MSRHPRATVPPRGARPRALAPALLAALAAAGCGGEPKSDYQSVSKPPTVQLIKPQVRTIVRTVGQPSFVEAYERTAIYPKLTAYIDNWVADIGDRVRKDAVLATLFVPELVEEFQTKDATVKLDEERIRLAEQVVKVAEAQVQAAEARLQEAVEILGKFEAEVQRWDTEVKRLKREVQRKVVDPEILLESTNQWKSSIASRDAAKASIDTAKAELLAAQETLAKDKVDVAVAKADLAVATSDWKKTGAMVGYLTLRSPFDGIIYERNANTFDFVLPNTGDPTANRRAPDVSSAGAAPIYVVDRTDIVRVFVDIPERSSNFVHGVDLRLFDAPRDLDALPAQGKALVVLARMDDKLHFRCFDAEGRRVVDAGEDELTGDASQRAALKELVADLWKQAPMRPAGTGSDGVWDKIPGSTRQLSPVVKDRVLAALVPLFGREKVPVGSRARVLVQAYRDEPLEGTVTRTSWALNVTSRTLRAEIDLHNPGAELLPGMYAYADVIIEHPNVRAVPEDALTYAGDKIYCWLYEEGRAKKVEVRTGIGDGEWIEITSLERPAASKADHPWTPVTGSESVILGDLSILADGGAVQVASGGDGAGKAPEGTAGRPGPARPEALARRP